MLKRLAGSLLVICSVLAFPGPDIAVAAGGPIIIQMKEKINPGMPEYAFQLYGSLEESKSNKVYTYNRLVIVPQDGGEGIQEIILPDMKVYGDQPLLLLKDVNFDGFKDILIKNNTTVELTYKCWLWDKQQVMYIPAEEFAKITNPAFDRDKKLITSLPEAAFSRTQYTRVYKVAYDTPVLIKETKTVLLDDETAVHYTVKERVGNQMSVTAEYDLPNEIILTIKEKIHSSLPAYELKVYGKRKLSGIPTQTYLSAHKIAVYKPGGELLQEINFDATRTLNGDSLGFFLEDMNFDGYKDIRIQVSTPPGPNIPYYCWLWDNSAAKFVKNEPLEKITAPNFDQDKETITSFVRAGAAHHLEYTYKYIGGVPTVVRVKERKGEMVNGEIIMRYITRELRDGELVVVEDFVRPYESDR